MSIFSDVYDWGFSALTGNVSPGDKAALIQGAEADIKQAAGPNASPDQVATLQAGQASAITSFLISIGADPSQAGLRTPIGIFGGSSSGLGCAESDAAGTSCQDWKTVFKNMILDPLHNLILIAAIAGGVAGAVILGQYVVVYLRKAGVK
jgi:hypothetical protein